MNFLKMGDSKKNTRGGWSTLNIYIFIVILAVLAYSCCASNNTNETSTDSAIKPDNVINMPNKTAVSFPYYLFLPKYSFLLIMC